MGRVVLQTCFLHACLATPREVPALAGCPSCPSPRGWAWGRPLPGPGVKRPGCSCHTVGQLIRPLMKDGDPFLHH